MQKSKNVYALFALIATLSFGTLQPSYAILDKTRFVTDMGVAFFAFHHWVYKPFREGGFSAGAPHRTATLVKGGAALLFAVNRLRAANDIVHKTKSPLLRKLAGPIDSLSSSFSNVGQSLKQGHFNPADITGLKDQVGVVQTGATAAGAPIKDRAVPIPGM